MLKKFYAIILGVALLANLLPCASFAAIPENSSLTMNGSNTTAGWVAADVGTIETYGRNIDDFEGLELSAENTTQSVYPDANLNQTSGVFVSGKGASAYNDSKISVINATDKNGETSKMLKLDGGAGGLFVWKVPNATGQITRYAFDFYFDKLDTTNALVFFACDSGSSIRNTNSDVINIIKEKTWYRFVAETDASYSSSSNTATKMYFLDKDGNVLYEKVWEGNNKNAPHTWFYNYTEPALGIRATNTSVIYVDNAELSAYKAEDYTPSIISSTIEDNATNVPLDTNTVELVFDQPLTATGAATIKAGSAEPVSCTVEKNGLGKKEHSYTITFPFTELAYETNYTLNLTGFTNGSKAFADDIVFSTPAEPNDLVYTDEFDFTYMDSGYDNDWTGYPSSSYNNYHKDNPIISDVFVGENNTYVTTAGKPALDNTAGRTSGALVYEGLLTNSTAYSQPTRTIDMAKRTPNSILEFTHDFKIMQEPDNTYIPTDDAAEWKHGVIHLGASNAGTKLLDIDYIGGTDADGQRTNGSWVFYDTYSKETAKYEVGTWYTLKVRQLPGAAREYIVTNAETGAEIISGTHPNYNYFIGDVRTSTGYFNLFRLDSLCDTNATKAFKIAFDNARLSVYDPMVKLDGDITCEGLESNNKVSFNLKNPMYFDIKTPDTETAIAIVAFYKGETLAGIEKVDLSLNATETQNFNITLSKNYDADSAKLFVWKDLRLLLPMSIATPFNVN